MPGHILRNLRAGYCNIDKVLNKGDYSTRCMFIILLLRTYRITPYSVLSKLQSALASIKKRPSPAFVFGTYNNNAVTDAYRRSFMTLV